MTFEMKNRAPLAFLLTSLLTYGLLEQVSSAAAADEAQGAEIYKDNCAGCHEVSGAKTPPLSALGEMSPDYLSAVLAEGKMKTQGNALGPDEKTSLIAWLTRDQEGPTDWEARATCVNPMVNLIGHAGAGNVADVGYGSRSLRHQAVTTITPQNVAALELDKVMAFPGAGEMRSQPALIGNTLFMAVAETSTLYAFDSREMCIKWTRKTKEALRSAVGYAQVGGRDILFFGAGKTVHVVDALSGEDIWSKPSHFFAMITAQPVLSGGVLYVAESSFELILAADPKYPCCKVSGAMKAYDVLSGELLWVTNMTPSATLQGKTSAGTDIWGPSGAPVWSTPTVDEARGLVYIGTGENYTHPTTDTSDAILALDTKTGAIKWKFQATAGDAYNAACRSWMGIPDGPSCPTNAGKDLDFGASVMMVADANGRELLIAGQKSGMVYALDPDAGGKLVWKTHLSDGTLVGGVHWNMSAMDGKIFVGINDPDLPIPDYKARSGLNALDAATGEILWYLPIAPSCEFSMEEEAKSLANGTRNDCSWMFGLSAGVTTAPGLVFTGGVDGILRAHSSKTGEILWQVATNKPFTSTWGPEGHGGAMDNNTFVIRGDRIYVQSGYAFLERLPGNVLLVYKLPG